MNNEEAYTFLTAQKNKTMTSIASEFIVLKNLLYRVLTVFSSTGLTVIPSEFKSHLIEIHTCLGAILRVYDSSKEWIQKN